MFREEQADVGAKLQQHIEQHHSTTNNFEKLHRRMHASMDVEDKPKSVASSNSREPREDNASAINSSSSSISATKDSNTNSRSIWALLSWGQRLEVFNLWFCVQTIGNCCNIVSSFHSIFWSQGDAFLFLLLRGLGCLLVWLSVLQFFEDIPAMYVVISTLRVGASRAFMFVLGVIPVFIGYAFFRFSAVLLLVSTVFQPGPGMCNSILFAQRRHDPHSFR